MCALVSGLDPGDTPLMSQIDQLPSTLTVGGANELDIPRYTSVQGSGEEPPGTSQKASQLRLLSVPTQLVPLLICRFFRQNRSVVCV